MKQTDYLIRFAAPEEPLDMEAYHRMGGYVGLEAALQMDPEEVIDVIGASKLAGRGGAGVAAGFKWGTVPRGEQSYIVCNADEGEPGTFKDRFLMEGAPYLVLEGMTIAAYAVGSEEGFIYVRGEYPAAIAQFEEAVERARAKGFLGRNILGKGFDFSIRVKKGGGSYVVGDETALLNSLMGNRGHPLHKPPYPTEHGLWDSPTLVNNVETLSCVPLILANGAEWFAGIGAETTPGPKLYPVSGHVAEPGVYEFPMGVTVGELLEAAGGVNGSLKAVQIGGTAGPIYDTTAVDYRLDFTSMRGIGGSLGSGAVVVMNSSVSMAHVLEVTTRFFAEESCGQCFGCRYGTRQLDYMARRIATGSGTIDYLAAIRKIATIMHDTSLCPFGQSVAMPLNTLLDNFGEEIANFITQQQYLKEVV
ncbi:MAG: complex I 51 kDa subunit family protein [bacterium]